MYKIIASILVIQVSLFGVNLDKVNSVIGKLKTKDGSQVLVKTDLKIDKKLKAKGSYGISIYNNSDSKTMRKTYASLHGSCDSAIGAIFMKKDKTHIVFIKENVETIISNNSLLNILEYTMTREYCKAYSEYHEEEGD